MRFGESFGEACRFCGSTEIIVAPPSSAGNCAVCSEEALAWAARRDQLARRHMDAAREAILAAAAERRAAERAQRRAVRRAAVVQAGAAAMAIVASASAQGRATALNAIVSFLRSARLLETSLVGASVSRARRLLLRAAPPRSGTAHNY